MRTDKSRRGQAMVEMAIAMLVFVLVLGGLLSFGSIIPESMRLQSMVRRMAGYEAQGNATGSVEGSPLPSVRHVLDEQEIKPLTTSQSIDDALSKPVQYRMQALSFTVTLESGTADWIWGGETEFQGKEECRMPVMTIPEFTAAEVLR